MTATDPPNDDVQTDVVTVAYQSYTLKRGVGASLYDNDDGRSPAETPYRRLLRELETSSGVLSAPPSSGAVANACSRVGITTVAAVKLLNDRCALLWRGDRTATSVRDACRLHDDVVRTMDSVAVALKHVCAAITAHADGSGTARRPAPLQEALRSLCFLELAVLPGFCRRVETYVRSLLRKDATAVFEATLRSDAFLGDARISPPKGANGNGGSGSGVQSADVVLLEVLSTAILDAYVATADECCGDNDVSVARLCSVGYNAAVEALLDHMLSGKLRFSHLGVAVFHAFLIKLQGKIVATKQTTFRGSSGASQRLAALAALSGDKGGGGFRLIQDMRPWERANAVLSILQTGVPLQVDEAVRSKPPAPAAARPGAAPARQLPVDAGAARAAGLPGSEILSVRRGSTRLEAPKADPARWHLRAHAAALRAALDARGIAYARMDGGEAAPAAEAAAPSIPADEVKRWLPLSAARPGGGGGGGGGSGASRPARLKLRTFLCPLLGPDRSENAGKKAASVFVSVTLDLSNL